MFTKICFLLSNDLPLPALIIRKFKINLNKINFSLQLLGQLIYSNNNKQNAKVMRKIMLFLTLLFFAGAQVLHAQRTITGTVTSSEDREGLPGVQVVVRGTTVGTVADFMGRYSINVPNDATHLVFTFMGMATQEIAIDGRTAINVVMRSDTRLIDEVVVVGYGSGRRPGTAVGSLQQVTSRDLQARPAANVMDGLQGRVAGLSVFTGSGEPGLLPTVRLHGVGSLGASSTPLYIVDGIQVSADVIRSMNANDFESVTILKDASATSIYGARAANGVIVITTKRGRIGQDAQVIVRSQYGVSRMAEKSFFDVFSAPEFFDFQVAAGIITQAQADATREEWPFDTRWIDVYMKDNIPTSQTDISVQGGGGRTMYFISGSYFDQEGTAHGSFFNRYTARANVESQAKDWLRVGMNMQIGRDQRRGNTFWGTNNLNGGLSALLEPYFTPIDPETGKEYNFIPGLNMHHPRYLAANQIDLLTNSQFIGSFFVEISPMKGLKIISRSGTEASDVARDNLRKPSWTGSAAAGGLRGLGNTQRITMTTNNVIEYRFNIDDQHNISALVGQEGILNDWRTNYTSVQGMRHDDFVLLEHGTQTTLTATSAREGFAFLSFFGRADYNLNERFFVDFSLRNDQCSRFGHENRSAWFWAAGAMWNMTNESFIQNLGIITDARVKISYGTQGNAEIGNYTHLGLTGTTVAGSTTVIHTPVYGNAMSLTMTQPENRFLTWEKQSKLTVGFRTELLNRYNIEFDFYQRATEAMLINVPLSFTTGFGNRMENVGTLTNTGFDLLLGMDFVRTRDYFVGANIVYNYNKDKVTKLFDGRDRWEIANTGVAWVVGSPVMYYYPIYAGVDPEDGRQMWYRPGENEDVTNKDPEDRTKTFSSALQQNTGIRRYAPSTGGFGVYGGWKGLEMNADFAFVVGKWMIDNTSFFTLNPRQFAGMNQSREVADFWTEENPNARFPDWRKDQRMQFDTHLLSNASFLRLKNLTISYNLPSSVIDRTDVLSNVRLFAIGRNLLTFTNFMGIDPEVDSNLGMGTYGNSKQFQVGIEIIF